MDDSTLKKMIAGRDREAIEYLYDNYSSVFYGLIRRIVQDDAIAEEILVNAFLLLADDIHHFHPGKISFFTWMLNICRKLALDKVYADNNLKQLYNQANDNLIASGNIKINASYSREAVPVKEKMEKLDREYKTILDLLYFQGLPMYETAKKLNIPLGTVKTRTHVALQRFRSIVQENQKTE